MKEKLEKLEKDICERVGALRQIHAELTELAEKVQAIADAADIAADELDSAASSVEDARLAMQDDDGAFVGGAPVAACAQPG